MGVFKRNKQGVGYLVLCACEVEEYCNNSMPVCNRCNKMLSNAGNNILIPLINEVYCENCGKIILESIIEHTEDKLSKITKEKYFQDFFCKADNPIKNAFNED